MTAIRNAARACLGVAIVASMFAVPMMTASAGGSYSMTVDHASPDGPDPVTVNMPELAVALPVTTGLPMSRAVHGGGTAGVGVASTEQRSRWLESSGGSHPSCAPEPG